MTTAEGPEVLRLAGPVTAASVVTHWAPLLASWTGGCKAVEVGSTGVPGLPTKGDVDLAVVAADAGAFARAVAALHAHLQPHEPEHWSATWAGFVGAAGAGQVGVQVVLSGSDEDRFLRGFRALLLEDPAVVRRYAALKRRHDSRPMVEYRAAKGRFVQEELAAMSSRQPVRRTGDGRAGGLREGI